VSRKKGERIFAFEKRGLRKKHRRGEGKDAGQLLEAVRKKKKRSEKPIPDRGMERGERSISSKKGEGEVEEGLLLGCSQRAGGRPVKGKAG